MGTWGIDVQWTLPLNAVCGGKFMTDIAVLICFHLFSLALNGSQITSELLSHGGVRICHSVKPAGPSWDLMPHINFLCSCTHWQSVWGPEQRQVSVWKLLLEISIGWCPCVLTCGWLADQLAGSSKLAEDMTRPTPRFAQPLSTFSFFLVAKVTPWLEEKHPTYCLHSWETRKVEKTDSERESRPV